MSAAAVSWLTAPLAEFVREARVRLALVLEPSGRVLAQHGFTRSLDVMAACSLAAAIHASASELGRQLGGASFGPLQHSGSSTQLFMAPLPAGGSTLLLVAVFDGASSHGIVRHFCCRFAAQVGEAAPSGAAAAITPENFERELGRNLAVLFGRA